MRFKFHYVSINSDIAMMRKKVDQKFKFHYVSINSQRDRNSDNNCIPI